MREDEWKVKKRRNNKIRKEQRKKRTKGFKG